MVHCYSGIVQYCGLAFYLDDLVIQYIIADCAPERAQSQYRGIVSIYTALTQLMQNHLFRFNPAEQACHSVSVSHFIAAVRVISAPGSTGTSTSIGFVNLSWLPSLLLPLDSSIYHSCSSFSSDILSFSFILVQFSSVARLLLFIATYVFFISIYSYPGLSRHSWLH